MEHDVDNPPLHFSDSATTRLSVRLARKLTTLQNLSWNLEVSHPPLPNYEQNKASRRMDQFAWFLSAIEKICVLENSFSFPSPAFVAFWSGSLEWKRTTYKLGRVVPDPSVRCLNFALHMTSDIPKIWRCHQRRIRPSLLPLKLVRFPLNYFFLLKCDMLLSLLSF